MMKNMIVAAAGVLVSCAAFAAEPGFSYLYWMVDITGESDDYAFSYATVSAEDTTIQLYNYEEGEGKMVPYGTKFGNDEESGLGFTAGKEKEGEEEGGAPIYAGDVSGYLGSTFLFELFNESDERVAWKAVSGSTLSEYIGWTRSQISTPYTVSDVVPEPTSALLALLGFAGLALKRKRA